MNINDVYYASLLSHATYADGLTAGDFGLALKAKLIDPDLQTSQIGVANGMSQSQAEYISNNYQVAYQETTTASGFSATLFQDVNTGEYIFSMRGTDGQGPDWTDANLNNVLTGVSRNQVVDMVNFYIRLTQSGTVNQYRVEEVQSLYTPTQPYYLLHPGTGPNPIPTYAVLVVDHTEQGLGVIDSNTPLDVVGHSLGGHLASAFTLLFSEVVQKTYTFNSAGFIAGVADEFPKLAGLLSGAVSELSIVPVQSASNVIDISAPLDFVSDIPGFPQEHLGAEVEVNVESVEDTLLNVAENHSMDRLTDALAVIDFCYPRVAICCGA